MFKMPLSAIHSSATVITKLRFPQGKLKKAFRQNVGRLAAPLKIRHCFFPYLQEAHP